MARLKRRGIGRFNIERVLNRDEYLRQSVEGLNSAYEQLWADVEKCIGDRENSYFWDLMYRVTISVMSPVVRDVTNMMNRSVLTAMMYWNLNSCPAEELAGFAYKSFERWFTEDLMSAYDELCRETDRRLLLELNEYIGSAMERDGVHPVHLSGFSAAPFYRELRSVMRQELLPAVEAQIARLIPTEIRDSRFAFIRRRRLRRAVSSFFALKDSEGSERHEFFCDILIRDNLMLEHANEVMAALRRSITAEKIRLCEGG